MPALTTLSQIRTKIRRLTRSPSPAQITDNQIDDYINTFVLYDFPAAIRINTLVKTLTFYTSPGVDIYPTSLDPASPLYDFKNTYITSDMPVYVSGNKSFFTLSRDQFYRTFPMVVPQINQQLSNGTVNYTGKLTTVPVLRNTITFSMTAPQIGPSAGAGLQVHDNGIVDPLTGLADLVGDGTGTINYITGDFTIVFDEIPPLNTWVQSSSYAYTAAQPNSVLYFDTSFYLRPVPDKVYPVVLNVTVRPTELLAGTDTPELVEWSQYIAFGTAKKIYEDRFDFESAQSLMVPFKEQEVMCLRRQIMQQKNQRAETIYNSSMRGSYWWNVWN